MSTSESPSSLLEVVARLALDVIEFCSPSLTLDEWHAIANVSDRLSRIKAPAPQELVERISEWPQMFVEEMQRGKHAPLTREQAQQLAHRCWRFDFSERVAVGLALRAWRMRDEHIPLAEHLQRLGVVPRSD